MAHNKKSLVEQRSTMKYNSPLGLYYLDLRKKSLSEGLSKSRVIPHIIYYLNTLIDRKSVIPSIADFGCGEGHMLAQIREFMTKTRPSYPIRYIGLDYNENLIKKARHNYPDIEFIRSNLAGNSLLKLKRRFDIIMMVNTLHEIFTFYSWNGNFDEDKGKKVIFQTLKNILNLLKNNGVFVLFDGIEHPDDLKKQVRFKLLTKFSIKYLRSFEKEYLPLKFRVHWKGKDIASMNLKAFTRFITKITFFDTPVWNLEREEMYQYFTRRQFEENFKKFGLNIEAENLLSPNLGLWNKHVQILSKDIVFPNEHMMIVGTKDNSNNNNKT